MTQWLTTDAQGYSHTGQSRSENQDYLGFREPSTADELDASGNLYVVADGVGGETRGAEASRLAVEKVVTEYYRSSAPDLALRLVEAFKEANREIAAWADRERGHRTATTLVAAVVHYEQLIVANVGDSRAYLIRGDTIQRLTRDHSLMQRLIDAGELTLEKAREFSKKNVLSRSIGGKPEVEVDITRWALQSGDILLFCTDGLHQYFWDDEELRPFISWDKTADQMAQDLVAAANARGGSDNITALVVKLGGTAAETLQIAAVPSSALEGMTVPGRPVPVPETARAAPASPPIESAEKRGRAAARPVTTRRVQPRQRRARPADRARLWATIGAAVVLVSLALLGGVIVGRAFFGRRAAGTLIPPATQAMVGVEGTVEPTAPPPTEAAVGVQPTEGAPALPSEPPSPEPSPPSEMKSLCAWEVRGGESVLAISFESLDKSERDAARLTSEQRDRYDEIVSMNDLKNPDLINAGDILIVRWSNTQRPFNPNAPALLANDGLEYPNCREFLP